MKSRWTRLLPVMIIAFMIAFMDRTNISFAIPTMGRDLGLTPSQLGFAAGVLFLGYGSAQLIGGWIADRGHGKLLITVTLVVWGFAEMAQAYVKTADQLAVVRVVLGLAEGGMFPTFMLFINNWFSPSEQTRANGIWQICYPLAAMVSGPLAGVILRVGNWRDLFIVEAIFPLVWVAAWVWGVADSPAKAKWLSASEKLKLLAHLKKERLSVADLNENSAEDKVTYLSELKRRPLIIFLFAIFFWNLGFLGFIIWMPSVMAAGGNVSAASVGWLSAVPFLMAIIVMQILPLFVKGTGNLNRVASSTILISGLSIVLGAAFGDVSIALNIVLLVIAGATLYASQPPIWSTLNTIVSKKVAGRIVGTMNASGVIGGFSGSYLVGIARDVTGKFSAGLWVLGGCLILSSVLFLWVRQSQGLKVPAVA